MGRLIHVLVLAAVLTVVSTLTAGPPAAADDAPETALTFDDVAALDELTADHATVLRLYWASFGRTPDPAGALYWIEQRDRCADLGTIAEVFADGEEFRVRYGRLDDEAFVERVYANVLGRAPDAGGAAHWGAALADGRLSRGGVILHVSLSPEFTDRHPLPSDDVPARSCHQPDGRPTGRGVHVLARVSDGVPLTTVAGLTIMAPSAVIERAGFHQSSHPGALPMTAVDPAPVRIVTMASRNRGTHRRGAIDIATGPGAEIVSPVAGTVARAGSYTLYCRYRDGYVVINPDGRPDLEVKILHVQEVAVRPGQRVAVGQRIAATSTGFPFRSQIDALTAEPSWGHVHIEVVDPSIPRNSSGGGC